MADIANITQYKSTNGIVAKMNEHEEGQTGSIYDSIYSFNKDGKNYYLITQLTIYSTSGRYASVSVCIINNEKLEYPKLINTSTGLHNSISYEYNMDVDEKKHEEITVLPQYDYAKNMLLIPIISGDTEQKFTGKYIKYHFNGQYFVKE